MILQAKELPLRDTHYVIGRIGVHETHIHDGDCRLMDAAVLAVYKGAACGEALRMGLAGMGRVREHDLLRLKYGHFGKSPE